MLTKLTKAVSVKLAFSLLGLCLFALLLGVADTSQASDSELFAISAGCGKSKTNTGQYCRKNQDCPCAAEGGQPAHCQSGERISSGCTSNGKCCSGAVGGCKIGGQLNCSDVSYGYYYYRPCKSSATACPNGHTDCNTAQAWTKVDCPGKIDVTVSGGC